MNTTAQKIQVLVSDERISSLIQELLCQHTTVLEVHSNNEESISITSNSCWDLLLLYTNTESMLAFEACRQIRAKKPYCQIIVISDGDNYDFNSRCLYHGADDCIPTPFSNNEFLARVSVAIRRSQQFSHLKKLAQPTAHSDAVTTQDDADFHRSIGDVRLCWPGLLKLGAAQQRAWLSEWKLPAITAFSC